MSMKNTINGLLQVCFKIKNGGIYKKNKIMQIM